MGAYVEGPRPFVVTSDDRRGIVAVFTTLLLVWMLLCYVIRLYLRLSPRLPLGWDDVVLAVATAFSVVQSAIVYVQVNDGYGESSRKPTINSVRRIEKANVASTIFYLLTLALTKTSVAFLLARMTRDKSHLIACKIVAIASMVWPVLSLVVIFAGCGGHPWRRLDPRCSNQYPRWLFVAITDVITDLSLLGLPIYLVWNLQTTFRRKAVVVVAFAFRIPVIVVALLRLHYLYRTINSPDPMRDEATSSVYTQFEINLGLMAATIPCAKPFIQAFYTGYLTHQVTAPALGKADLPSYALSDLSSGKSSKHQQSLSFGRDEAITVPKAVFKADVLAGADGAVSERGPSSPPGESGYMAIRRTAAWSVYTQPASSPSTA